MLRTVLDLRVGPRLCPKATEGGCAAVGAAAKPMRFLKQLVPVDDEQLVLGGREREAWTSSRCHDCPDAQGARAAGRACRRRTQPPLSLSHASEARVVLRRGAGKTSAPEPRKRRCRALPRCKLPGRPAHRCSHAEAVGVAGRGGLAGSARQRFFSTSSGIHSSFQPRGSKTVGPLVPPAPPHTRAAAHRQASGLRRQAGKQGGL